MKNFNGLGLNPVLAKSLVKMKYDTPTPIQAKAIPLALDGRDIMGSAQTGTGKTAAFSIPLVQSLLNDPNGGALVLTPTRELGKQVLDVITQLLGPNSDIHTAFLIGGDSMQKQNNQLKRKPRLIVGTPGRINDHLDRGSLKLNDTRFLVLDETDRMLDMGFTDQLERIVKQLPRERQTMMFSATMPKNIMQIAEKYLNNAERIAVGSTIEPAKNIKQETVRVSDGEKYDELLRQLENRAGTIVMFVKTKYATERMAKRLKSDGYEADALHGDLKQSRRDRVLTNFRDMKFQILVATDVAARGLDIPHIQHVINFDLPQVPEDFIHRIGRTARAGALGEALSFISPQEGRKWHAIEMLMDPTMKGSSMPNKNAAKPRGKKPFGKKPFDKSSDRRDDKPFGKKPFGKSKKGAGFAGKPFGKKPEGKTYAKPSNDRFEKRDDQKFGDRDTQRSDNRGEKRFDRAEGGSSEANFKKKNPFQRGQKNSERGNDRNERSDRNDRGNNRNEGRSNDRYASDKREGSSEGKKSFGGFKGKPRSSGDGQRFEKSDRPDGAKKTYGGFKGKPRTEGGFSEGRKDGNSFAKKKSAGGGFKGGAGKAPFKGAKTGGAGKFGAGANKSRPKSGGAKRPARSAA